MIKPVRYLIDLLRFFGVVFLLVFVGGQAVFALEVPGGQTKQGDTPSGRTAEEAPEGQRIGGEVMGPDGGYIHPFLLVEGRYTDNLYYTDTNEEDDFITSVSPGLWVAVPSNREKLVELQTSNTSPGGLRVSRIKPEATRRMQSYFLYSPEFVTYADNSTHDHVDHTAEGMFQYNFDTGLSIDVMDKFNKNNEINNNASGRLDEYYDNLFNFLAVYEPSEKLRFRADYSNYLLDYDDSANEFRDRVDNSVSMYVFYKVKPKTSVFVEYDFADINYDENSLFDSQEHRYYAGVDWDVTAKTRGRAKMGLIEKNFDESGIDDEEGFSMEVQAQHNFSPKRAINLNLFRHYTESSIGDSWASMTTGADAALLQRFTEKWSSTVSVNFTRDDYEGAYTSGGKTDEREDDTFRAGASLIFEPRDWLSFDLGYYYSNRDSNFSEFDFENNTVYITAELVM
ncbi:MAG: outer membrane beta-barrel protein [Desulfobacteraceae bacterium]